MNAAEGSKFSLLLLLLGSSKTFEFVTYLMCIICSYSRIRGTLPKHVMELFSACSINLRSNEVVCDMLLGFCDLALVERFRPALNTDGGVL